MTSKSEDAEFAKYRRALNNILQAIKPLKARDAGAALAFALAQIIVFAIDDGDDKPDMKKRLSRLAAANRALGTMVEHLIREAFRQDEAAIKRAEARAAREKE